MGGPLYILLVQMRQSPIR